MVALLNAVHTAPVRVPVVTSQRSRSVLRASALPAHRSVVVRASTEEREVASKAESIVEEASTPNLPPPPASSPAVASPVPSASPSFGDVFAFAGPGPEVINGRLAMLAFVAAAGAEFATGFTAVQQLAEAPVLVGITFAVFIIASLIPMFRGVSPASKSNGPFTPTAEMLNGRAAMLGFVALLATEWAKGAAVF
ncbi:hypothetical protein WJX81_003579 [Elliptochloris bilobata]|uniref:Uncharacterized protein n=1 Tax=Elliptochloris bilobata TaxID=381761 RepID=A0AAW1SHB1_9CHLO